VHTPHTCHTVTTVISYTVSALNKNVEMESLGFLKDSAPLGVLVDSFVSHLVSQEFKCHTLRVETGILHYVQ
jgi:hypothetical protein